MDDPLPLISLHRGTTPYVVGPGLARSLALARIVQVPGLGIRLASGTIGLEVAGAWTWHRTC